LISRQEWPDPQTVRCLVPVSVRAPGDPEAADNRISALLIELPIDVADPVEAYHALLIRTRDLKSSSEALAGEWMVQAAGLLPPRLVGAALHTAFRVPQRFVTTVTTNVPGPRWPLYLMGRRMISIYPYVPLADQIRIAIAITSYDGRLYFGVTSDRQSVPDAEVLVAGITAGLADLACTAAAMPV
jgi:diacylglycerol O-acyltransferase